MSVPELVADEVPQDGPEHPLVDGARVGLAVLAHEPRHQLLDRVGRYDVVQLAQDQAHVRVRVPSSNKRYVQGDNSGR